MWKQKIVQTTRGMFEVFTKGHGTPLCVTHHYSSFNETGDYFADSFTHSHTVILINLRECGHSAQATEPYQLSFIETILDLEAIRTSLGYKKWGFAGHSTGGMLGIIYGIHFSDSLHYTIIVGAAAREYQIFSPTCIYNKQHPQYENMQQLTRLLSDKNLTAQEKESYKVERTKLSLYKPDLYSEFFNRNIHKSLNPIRLHYFSREVVIFDVTKQLTLIQTPTLIICGKHDVQCPVTYSIEMAGLIPTAELVIFYESNHYPFLEEKAKFTSIIDSFFQQLSDHE
ncbi:alpha/beta fold hydrolase [Alkalihalobacillus pseudalcaliphilus]|uniref:alpha/beta fold hydrolase n=1 Tax=Alkalihalobacillus pseudalcaliphilus TaxID=79884 RepID=UPI00064D8C40|nr:alpha/beta hydrolase [Alkalihalobacillus pseudalcaliphilus]KMK76780.1 proline iminopeptidase [Alkalihalobacillus pseudalcaliphilus]